MYYKEKEIQFMILQKRRAKTKVLFIFTIYFIARILIIINLILISMSLEGMQLEV